MPKQLSPIDVTDEGIVISFSETHFPNALFPIDVTDKGIVTSFNLVQE